MADAGRKKRVLWLHTQPEHYFNCMMDDLARGKGYAVAGMEDGNAGEFEYVAAFSAKGPGWYKESAPRVARTVFLRVEAGKEGKTPGNWEKYHVDWRADLMAEGGGGGFDFDAVIVSGYALRTHREVIGECRRRRIPVALWSDSNIRSQRGRGLKARWRRGLKKVWLQRAVGEVDLMLTANSCGVAYWRYYGVPRERIMVCPYYADYPRIDAARRSARAEVLGKIGVSPGRKVLFSAARLVPVKGLDQLIVQFLENDFAGKGWTYVIAGVGPLEGQLKELAAGKGRGAAGDQGGSVVFVGFQQPAENLALMAHAEMLGLPSRYEPHGIVVAEAMAAGTPVLASDVVGAAKDLVKSGVNGLIFRSGDAGDLRNKLEIMEDAGKMAMMRNEARSAFEAWYLATSPMHVVPAAVRRMLGMAAGKAHTVAAYVAT